MFEIAGGSVPGRDHVRIGKNSQDAYYWEEANGILVGAVCDGCGSNPHSEVGAKIGAKLIVKQTLCWYLEEFGSVVHDENGTYLKFGLKWVRRNVLFQLQSLIDSMAGKFSENVRDYFLFTALGFIVDPKLNTCVFGCGDGSYWINGMPTTIMAPNNAPDYLGYGLVDTVPVSPVFITHECVATSEIKSLLIGTDGVADLAKAHDLSIPGKDEKIGPISQFWEKDGFFKNPFSIGHRLALVNRSISRIDWEKKCIGETHGPLRDDTTLVVIRRQKA